ncbi:alpha/beta hydrolase [Prochlorococcus sp. MIT 1341]|uniref:alpha/beta hydrolase n=1 Tax=Prochlorococcus sp. MIT 1341 TaxID=3096221 RepID=UPI002A74B98B|nr:alpha/beta hydrolase [Prochlorococcus sp. MIT 1341]
MTLRKSTKRIALLLFSSLLLSWAPISKLEAADQLEVVIDGTVIPVSIKELTEWGRLKKNNSELANWLNLLEPENREGLIKILKAPLLKELSMGRQMLRSWAGQQLLDEVSDLLLVDMDSSGSKLFETLERLLERQTEVSTLDLLEALPAVNIRLDLDALFQIANRWRLQLKSQQRLSAALSRLPSSQFLEKNQAIGNSSKSLKQELISLEVKHRSNPLVLEVWNSSNSNQERESWVLLMPGLGGSQNHFRWLARYLNQKGWSVVVLEHPGSDSKAVKALLEGREAAPGAEVIPERMEDLKAVLLAKKTGALKIRKEKLVLMGHSLGALTAFIAGGATPIPGLERRCKKALEDLSLTNLSQLLQCQLNDVDINNREKISDLKAIVALNSFGSLLWPKNGDASINVPVLIAGGTLDLITPPLSEQLGLLLATPINKNSRVVIIEGASHFSPIRVEKNTLKSDSEDLFRFGEDLVGIKPLQVQRLLAQEIANFIEFLENKKPTKSEDSFHKKMGDIRMHRLSQSAVRNLLSISN